MLSEKEIRIVIGYKRGKENARDKRNNGSEKE